MTTATQQPLITVEPTAHEVIRDLAAVVRGVMDSGGLLINQRGCLPGCQHGLWVSGPMPAAHSKRCQAARDAVAAADRWLFTTAQNSRTGDR